MKIISRMEMLILGQIVETEENFTFDVPKECSEFKIKYASKNRLASFMKEGEKKLGVDTKIRYSAGTLCGTCDNITTCEKVRDKTRKSLFDYPFLENAIRVRFIDEEKSKEYNEAFEEYIRLQEEAFYDPEEHHDLELKLADNGEDIDLINVYKCKNYRNFNLPRKSRK